MPLKLSVSKGEKFIVNGAVIRSDGDHADLVFENQAHILRQKDVLTSETASTPAARIYFALQCAYLFPDKAVYYLEQYRNFLREYLEAAPSAKVIADEVEKNVQAEHLYQALRACAGLIEHERNVLAHAP